MKNIMKNNEKENEKRNENYIFVVSHFFLFYLFAIFLLLPRGLIISEIISFSLKGLLQNLF